MMKRISIFSLSGMIGFLSLLFGGFAAEAADIKLTCTHALKAVALELIPQFERATGHKVAMRFDVIGGVRRQIEAGDAFDVACLNPPMIEEKIKKGKIAAGSIANVARVGIGVAVRAGAPKPDIGTAETFKKTLLNAKSVAHSGEGLSGVHFKKIIAQLGIADQLKPKLVATPSGGATASVVNGEADMVVVVISTIVADPGVDLAGPLPADLQAYTTFSVGISAASKEPQAAAALIKHLTAPAAAPVIRAKGMEPG